MKNLKSKIFASIALLAFVFGVLFIAGAMDNKNNIITKNIDVLDNKLFTTMWLELDVSSASNPNNPTDSESEITNGGSPSPSCDPSNSAEVCGIELDITNILSNDPTYEFEGKTVAQVIADGAQHIPDGTNPKSYSRKP